MGDITIAQDILDGVADALGDLGDTRTFRIITTPTVDKNNPGETPIETKVDIPVEAVLFDFDEKYMPNANILEGESMAILSIDPFSDVQVDAIVPGNRLIDNDSTTIYEIIKANPIEAAGIKVTVIIQLKG